jgi:class 3 adenylate cyclase
MRLEADNQKPKAPTISSDERFFVEESMQRRHLTQTDAAVKVGLAGHGAAIAVLPFLAQAEFKTFLIVAHSVVALASVFCLNGSRWQGLAVKYLFPLLIVVLPLCYLYTVRANVVMNLEHETLYAALAAFMICIFASILDPGSIALQLGISALISIAGYWAYEHHPLHIQIAIVNAVASFTAVGFTTLYKLQHRQLALREYNLLIRAAPAKIVRQAASSQVTILEAFSPKTRHCVCISSDWRGYQELSSKISATDLASALGHYYEACTQLLNDLFPDGNFYTDWIADELFIVIFAKDQQEEKVLVNQALRFSGRMLEQRKTFFANFGIPKAIDIGISSGTALIGMMGPGTHRKATALGDVPGIARRLQAAGKLIRHHHGDRDRVIFSVNTLMEITEGFEIHEFSLANGEKIRDLTANKIFFMEHVSADEQAA